MGVVAASAIPMSFYRPVFFLALVAVFSFYLAFASYRVLRLKELARGGRAQPIDWIAGVLTLGSSLLLVWLGLFRPASTQVVGVVGVAFGLIDVRRCHAAVEFRPQARGEDVLVVHTFRVGTYIAAWSAFSAVTLPQLFGNHWCIWL